MLAHNVDKTDLVQRDEHGTVPSEWLAHQIATSANFATKNHLLNFYLGGTNYQIEHHAFPKMCSVHYPGISPIVENVCQQYGIPYNSYPTFWSALKSHYRKLRYLSKDRDEAVTLNTSVA